MSDLDPKLPDNGIAKLLENPVTIGFLMVLVVLGVAMGWLDGVYAIFLLGVGAFGIFRALQKKKS